MVVHFILKEYIVNLFILYDLTNQSPSTAHGNRQLTFRRNIVNQLIHFCLKECGTKRKLLIEHPDIIYWQSKYLRSIKEQKYEGKNIIYINKSWMDNISEDRIE
ncbi:hypothetical protein C0J52_14142 [Blattella germanica]|nr:hypothetical protein C0J52_14142 [Blattella germanica]